MRVRSPQFAAFVFLGTLAVFVLPLAVPMPPTGSYSYILGFNNHVALLAYLAVLAIGCFSVRGLTLAPPVPDRGLAGPDRRTVLLGLLVTFVLCLLLTWVASPTWGMDESPYLIGRVYQVLAGHRPYVDFEFIYGPVLLYLPAWTSRLLNIGIGPAYFIIWTLEWLTGVIMAAFVVRGLGFRRERANTAFWVLLSLFLSSLINTGETYTPLRELAAVLSILAVHHFLVSSRRWLAFLVAVLAAAAIFLISPEMALAFMASTALYLLLCAVTRENLWRDKSYVAGSALTLLAFYAELRLAMHAHEFDSAKQFGHGGSDTPLLLTPTIFFVFAMIFIAGTFAARRLLERDLRDARIAASIVGFALLPGALGRADPTHLVLYGMSAMMVTLALASTGTQKTWRTTVVLTVLLCSAPLFVMKLNIDRLMFYDSAVKMIYPNGTVPASGLGQRLDSWVLHRLGPSADRKFRRRMLRSPQDPHVVYPQASAVLAAPFGYRVPGYPDTGRPDVILGYFDGSNDVMSAAQIERKLNEFATHPERDLLVPVGFDPATSCIESPKDAAFLLSEQYGYNYLHRQRNVPHVDDLLCEYIGTHYVRIATPPQLDMSLYDLWRSKTSPSL